MPQGKNQEINTGKDEILKTRFIERNFEKIQASLKSLAKTSPKDYTIIALLAILIVLHIFGPSSFVSWKAADQKMEKQIETLGAKINKLEKTLLTPTEEDSPPSVKGKRAAASPQATSQISSKTAIKGEIKSYKIKSGDTLSVIILKVYNSREPEVIEALAEYNNLKHPYIDIYPGTIMKVPPLKELMEWKKTKDNKSKTGSKS